MEGRRPHHTFLLDAVVELRSDIFRNSQDHIRKTPRYDLDSSMQTQTAFTSANRFFRDCGDDSTSQVAATKTSDCRFRFEIVRPEKCR